MPATPTANGIAPPQRRSTWRLVFQIVRWSTYAAAIITLLMIFHAAPPPVIPTSPQAAARVEEKIQAAEQSVAAGNPATLRLDETELNSYLLSHLDISTRPPAGKGANRSADTNSAAAPDPTAGLPIPTGTPAEQVEQVRSTVRDVKVQLIDDRARAYVVFDFHGKDMTLQLEGKLTSSGGYLRFEPVSGQFGSLPIPQSALQSAVQKMMASPQNRNKFKLPPEISDLRIENGEIVMTYR